MLVPDQFSEVIRKELKPGEFVEWADRPNSFYSMVSAIPAFLFGIPWNALLFFMHEKRFSENESVFLDIFILPFYLVGIYLFLSPLLEWRKARKKIYVISNRRAFTIEAGKTTAVESFYPRDIGNIEKIIRSNGSGNLILSRTYHTDNDGDRKTTAYGFFALPDVVKAERHLDKLLNA